METEPNAQNTEEAVLIENTDVPFVQAEDFLALTHFIFNTPRCSTISPQKQTVKNRSKSTEEVQQAKKVMALQNANVTHISI